MFADYSVNNIHDISFTDKNSNMNGICEREREEWFIMIPFVSTFSWFEVNWGHRETVTDSISSFRKYKMIWYIQQKPWFARKAHSKQNFFSTLDFTCHVTITPAIIFWYDVVNQGKCNVKWKWVFLHVDEVEEVKTKYFVEFRRRLCWGKLEVTTRNKRRSMFINQRKEKGGKIGRVLKLITLIIKWSNAVQ